MDTCKPLRLVLCLGLCLSVDLAVAQDRATRGVVQAPNAVLWTAPVNIKSRNLFLGPGGKQDEPVLPVEFVHEIKSGASPKFEVRDQRGEEWTAKLGDEAQPETVATRLLWAVGYFSNENYFVSDLSVTDLGTLHRGQKFVRPGGHVRAVRLQRHLKKSKDPAIWRWRHNPFTGTREFNGLRVMMALTSNWDLRDENNAILVDPNVPGRQLYEVSDVGASFGMNGKSYTDGLSKNNPGAYRHSKFIAKVTRNYVDFNFPTHPPIFYVFAARLFFGHVRMRWVGKHIPLADARWIGSLLSQLSRDQISDAFRAAGYTPPLIEAYTDAVLSRIAQLGDLPTAAQDSLRD